MKPEDINKLLGGYATGTLTAAEREALFAAALEDQRLFEELLQEEPIREALTDRDVRTRLLTALDEAAEAMPTPKPWYYRDVPYRVLAGAAAAIVIVTLAVRILGLERMVLPINVAARPELPQPTKSVLPTTLPPFQFDDVTKRRPVPQLPAAPVIAAQGPLPAVNQTIAQLGIDESPLSPAPAPVPTAMASLEMGKNAAAARAPAFSARAPAAQLPLRFTILKRQTGGEFAAVDGGQVLNAGDETAIRFESAIAGFVYVFERSGESWRRVATEQVEPSVAYTVPADGAFHDEGNGSRELAAVFSPEAQAAPEVVSGSARPVGAQGPVSSAAKRPGQAQVFITLKYPPR